MAKTYTFDEIAARNRKPKYSFYDIVEKNKNLAGTQNRQTAAKEPAIQEETALPEIKAPRFAGITPSVRLPETVEDAVKIIDSGKSMAPSAVSGYKPPERVRAIDRAVDLANADRTANLIANAGKENRADTEEYQARLMSDPAAKTIFRAANIAASPVTAAAQSFADIGIAVSDLFRGGLGISDREFEDKLDYLVNGSKFAPLFNTDEKLLPETGVGKAAYDFGTNLGRMAPTILTNLATGKDGVGKTALGLSAKGAALRNALDEGATLDKASMYSTLSGLTEVATESLFSPVEKIVGGAISKTGLEKSLSKIFTKLSASKAGRKIISGVSFALSNLGEGAEEMISEAMDPIWKRITYNKDAENASADDIIQAGVQGVIFSLGLSGLYGGANILAERSAAAPKDANISSTEAESAAATDAQNRLYEEIAAGRVPAESAAQTAPTASAAAENASKIEETDDTAVAEPEIEERNETESAATAWKITAPDDSARTKLLKDILEINEDVPSDEVEAEFDRFYRIGRIGLPYARAQEIQVYKDVGGLREAYMLGQDEYAAEAAKKRERLRSGGVSFYGKSAGLVMNRYTDSLTQGQRTALSKASKALGIKTVLADSVRGGTAQGVYNNGVVAVEAGNANIYGVARHEFTHRFAEAAPAGFEEYKNAVLSFMAEEDGVSESDLIAAKIAEYKRQGVDLSESKAAEEIAARFSERLFDGDDAAFERLCGRDVSLGRKILDVISDIIDKIKAVFTNKNTASYKAAQSDIDNLETLRSRWEQLYNDAAKDARGKENVVESENPGNEMFYNVKPLEEKKLKQLEIIQQTNPMTDDYHTGIRSVDDIKTAEEVFTDDPDDYIYPDFTVEDGQRALESGEVTVYSSKRIKNGTFVSPSEMNARDYAGGRNATVFSKKVNIDDVAWIDGSEGMYARVSETTGDFSLKEDMTETEQLRELLLKTRFEKRTVIRPSEIRSQVKKILRSYNIPEDVISADRAAEVLTNHINDYQYGYTAEGSTDLSVNDRALHRLVDDIIANATRVDSEMADNYGEIRNYLKTVEIKVPRSVIYDFGEAKDFMAFRRSLFGVMPHIKQTDSIGANIDLVYKELNDMAPELFPEDITSEADQLNRLAEVAMQLRPSEAPYFDEVTPELRSAIETELYGTAFREWHDKRDRYDAATEKIIGRYEKRISEIEAAARNKVEEYRKKKIEETEKIREEYKQQARQERLDRLSTEARTRLLKVARRLQKMKTTPENLALINETVGNIYTGALSKTQKTENYIAALAAAVEEYRAKHSDDIVLSDTQKAALADATKTAISDMSVEQVQNVVDTALALEHQIQTQNRLIGERKAREKAEYAEKVTAEFEHSAKVMNIKRISLFSDFRFTMPNATRFFRQISGYKDDGAIMELAKDIDKGQTEKIRIEHEVQSMFDDILKDKQSLREFTGPHAKEIDCGALETGDGIRKLTLTPAMRVSLYLLSKDDHAMLRMSDGTLDGITGGGLTVPDIKLLKKGRIQEAYSAYKPYRIDRDKINEIWKDATPFEKKIAATVEEYMNVVAPKYINRTSLELLGYEKAGSGYYFPIVSDPKLLGKEVKQVNADGSLEGWGHLKDRVTNSRNTILLQDVFQVMSEHLDGTAKYAGLAVPIRNFNTVFHAKTDVDDSVERSLETSWGKAATDYVNALLSDLQGGREKSKKSATMKVLKGAASRAKSVALTLNARSTIKQVSQFAQAASVVGFKNVLQGLKNVAVNVAPLELIEEYSPLLWSRKKPWSFGELYSGKRSVDRFLPDWNSAVDAACIRRLWSVAEYYVRDNSPGLKTGSDEYYKEVAKVWEKITKESQASFEIVQLPAVMRDRDSIMQILTAFRTDPFNKYGQLADAVGELRMKAREFRAAEKNGDADLSEKRKAYGESKKKFARVVGGISSAVTVTAVASLLASILLAKTDKYEDDKGEMTAESIAQGLLQDAGDELTGMVLFGQQIYDLTLSVMNGEPFYGASNIFLDDIGEVFSSTSNLLRQTEKMFDGSGNSESLRISAQKFAKTLAEVCGVPVSNVTNMIYGAAMNTSKMFGSYEAEYSIMRFRYGLSSKKSEYYDLIYRAYKNSKSEYRALRRKMISDGFKADAIDKQILKRKQMEK